MKKRVRLYSLAFAILAGVVFGVFFAFSPATWPFFQRYYSHQIQIEANSILAEASQNADKATEDFRLSYALSALAEAQSLAGNAVTAHQAFLKARQTANQIKDTATQVEALKSLAQAERESGDTAGARQTLRDATHTADTITSITPRDWVSRRDDELQHIGKLQAEAGDLADAQNTADEIHDSRSKSIVLTIIAEKQLDSGKMTEASHTIQNGDSHDKAIVLSEIADAQIKTGKASEARQTILDALQTASGITRAGAQTLAWAAIADSQAQAGDISGAVQTANQIDSNSTKQNTLKQIVEWQAKAGDITGARRTTAMISDNTAKSAAIQAIAEAQAKSGDTAGAKQTTQDAYQTAVKTKSSSGIFSSLCAIAGEQTEAKDTAGARRTLQDAAQEAEKISDSLLQSIALVEIADAQIEAGDADDAVKSLSECPDDSSKVQRLETVAQVQTKRGDAAGARSTLQIASRTIENIVSDTKTPETDNFSSFSRIIARQEQAGDTAGALKTLRQLHKFAEKISDPSDKSITLSDIIIGLYAPQ